MRTASSPKILPLFLPHFGCPGRCIFCNASILGSGGIADNLEVYLQYLKSKLKITSHNTEIAFYGGTFTSQNQSVIKNILSTTRVFFPDEKSISFRISTRPDAINKENILWLKELGVKTLEIGVESSENEVLELCQRGHTIEQALASCQLVKENGLKLGMQLMFGLPDESPTIDKKNINTILASKPDFVRISPTLVLPETILAEWYKNGKYQPLTLEETIKRGKLYRSQLAQANIPLARFGLLLTSDGDKKNTKLYLAGPYHPALRELIDASLVRDSLEKILGNNEDKLLNIYYNPRDNSIVKGYRRNNRQWLERNYPEKKVVFTANDSLERFSLLYNNKKYSIFYYQ